MLSKDKFLRIECDFAIFLPFFLIYLRQCLADLFPEVPLHEFGEILIAVALGDWRSSRLASPGLAGRAGW